jgi:hypothetical protein
MSPVTDENPPCYATEISLFISASSRGHDGHFVAFAWRQI